MKDKHINELIYLYHQGNEWAYEELFCHAKRMIFKMVNSLLTQSHNEWLEKSECVQIGLVTFQKSLDYYSESKEAAFSTYFYTMLKYSILNYRTQVMKQRQKETTFDYLRDFEKYDLLNHHQAYGYDPRKMLRYHNILEDLQQMAQEVTGLERQVILCLLQGEGTKEMSRHLDIDRRQINNALYRIRKKIRIIHQ